MEDLEESKNNIIFSVVTVVYNAVNEIKETIESIFAFLDSSHELIVIDGGSTDGTLPLLYSYSHPSYHIISEKDNGIYDAMNKGVSHAKGEWITFINSGDRLLQFPHKLDDTFEAICFAVQTDNGIIIPKVGWKIRIHNTLPHQGLYYKRDLFTNFNDSLKIFADYDYNLKLYYKSSKISIHQETVAFHSLTGISNSRIGKKELLGVIKTNSGVFWYILALLRFRTLGMIKRIKKIIL